MGGVKITSLATYAFNAIMHLSRASTRGRYSRIEGVTRGEGRKGGESSPFLVPSIHFLLLLFGL